MGWLKDRPDFRDLTPDHEAVAPMLRYAGVVGTVALPTRVDLRQYCSEVPDQGALGSCTANAAAGLLEYSVRRAHGEPLVASRLFIYKATRRLMRVTGDTGAYLRQTMGALALFGACPESYWPYDEAKFDKDPDAFCYGFADHYSALKYFRLDGPNVPTAMVQERLRHYLAAGLPALYGFTVYSSIKHAERTGQIPFPEAKESVEGGHANLLVGYDDEKEIVNPAQGSAPTIGAFLTKNSWGPRWGEEGYGWLPYAYVLAGLADDFWAMSRAAWMATGQFGFDAAA